MVELLIIWFDITLSPSQTAGPAFHLNHQSSAAVSPKGTSSPVSAFSYKSVASEDLET